MYILISLFIHAAIMTSIIRITGIYQDSMVLMEQGTSCIDIEIQSVINSSEIQRLKSSKNGKHSAGGSKKLSQQKENDVKAVAHHETVKNKETSVKAEELVKKQSTAEKHCIETDAVGRKAKKKRRMHPIRTRTKEYQI